MMLTTSKYIIHGISTRCAFCEKSLSTRDGYVEFWRSANGEHFCSEFCADDGEEARFRMQHALSSLDAATQAAQATSRRLISF
jgi:hypothetical protein